MEVALLTVALFQSTKAATAGSTANFVPNFGANHRAGTFAIRLVFG